MTGIEWLKKLMHCEDTEQHIPLELDVTMPFPIGEDTVICWYYRIHNSPNADAPEVYAPECRIVWDIHTMRIQSQQQMKPVLLGHGADLLTREHREKENKWLNGIFTDSLNGKPIDPEAAVRNWTEAAPEALRTWLKNEIETEINKTNHL